MIPAFSLLTLHTSYILVFLSSAFKQSAALASTSSSRKHQYDGKFCVSASSRFSKFRLILPSCSSLCAWHPLKIARATLEFKESICCRGLSEQAALQSQRISRLDNFRRLCCFWKQCEVEREFTPALQEVSPDCSPLVDLSHSLHNSIYMYLDFLCTFKKQQETSKQISRHDGKCSTGVSLRLPRLQHISSRTLCISLCMTTSPTAEV